MALNLAFLSCGGNDSDTKLKGIFDGIGPWSGSANNSANGDQLYMSFTSDNKFTLDINDTTNVKKWKVVGTFDTKDGKLSLEPTGYYDLSSANPDKLVDFATASSADKQAIEAKLTETFGDYKAIGYDSNNNNISFSNENSGIDFTKDDKSNFIPPADPVDPNDPIYEDDDEVINLTEWLNDPANNWTVGKPNKKSAYEYTGTSKLTVPNDRVLKILPATTITFTQRGGGFVVQGIIDAKGLPILKDTSGNDVTYNGSPVSGRIVLKSNAIVKGNWSGVEIASSSTLNVLDYVDIINAGYVSGSARYEPINVNNGNVAVTNCFIDGALQNGIYVTGTTGVLRLFDNNKISNCGWEPLRAEYLGALQNISSNNTFTNDNTPNHIEIGYSGNTNSRIPDGMTLKNTGVPYYFPYGLNHNAGSILTIEAGIEILVGADQNIVISSGSKLIADGDEGTAQKPITFRPLTETAEKGSWGGIEFQTSGNKLNYVNIKNGGRVQGTGYYAPIRIIANSSVSVTNSTIDGSKKNGIRITADTGVLDEFDNNTIKNCDEEPIYANRLWPLRNIGTNNTYSNTIDRIKIGEDSGTDVNDSAIPAGSEMTIQNIGVPYYFALGLGFTSNSTLTIKPGVVILIGSDSRFAVGTGSHLVAIGEPTSRITFRGVNDTKGEHRGIGIATTGEGSRLAYCDISGGGGNIWDGTMTYEAGLNIRPNAYIELLDVKLSKSSAYGLKLNGTGGGGHAYVWSRRVTFEDNNSDDVWEYTISSPYFTTYNGLPDRNDFTPTVPLE